LNASFVASIPEHVVVVFRTALIKSEADAAASMELQQQVKSSKHVSAK
jgi:hypothetical protein